MNRAPPALKFIRQTNNIVDKLKEQNEDLDIVNRGLEAYVESKREIFARFYFLSFETVIEILSESENKAVISLHLKTLFDGIVALTFENEQVTEMFSKEKEKVALHKPVKTRAPIEQWLFNLQESMKDTVYRKVKDGQKAYTDEGRKDWVLQHPGQVVATVAQIQWCSNTEDAINEMPVERTALTTWKEKNDKQIEHLTYHVRSNLSELHRHIIVALITTDVHARDIVDEMKQANVSSINDFNWQKQLRYYYDEDITPQYVKIEQVQARLLYGGEYMGATSRLVITPLTDRCWITITGALHIKLGANPAGPAGTGKTESTKDLAKAIATLCVVFNCSD